MTFDPKGKDEGKTGYRLLSGTCGSLGGVGIGRVWGRGGDASDSDYIKAEYSGSKMLGKWGSEGKATLANKASAIED